MVSAGESLPCSIVAGFCAGAGLFWLAAVLPSQSESQPPSGIRMHEHRRLEVQHRPAISPRSLMSAAEISGNKKVSVLPALTELLRDGSKG